MQEVLRCLWEIREAVTNQRTYPQEKHLALIGEMDWREELHGRLSIILGEQEN